MIDDFDMLVFDKDHNRILLESTGNLVEVVNLESIKYSDRPYRLEDGVMVHYSERPYRMKNNVLVHCKHHCIREFEFKELYEEVHDKDDPDKEKFYFYNENGEKKAYIKSDWSLYKHDFLLLHNDVDFEKLLLEKDSIILGTCYQSSCFASVRHKDYLGRIDFFKFVSRSNRDEFYIQREYKSEGGGFSFITKKEFKKYDDGRVMKSWYDY